MVAGESGDRSRAGDEVQRDAVRPVETPDELGCRRECGFCAAPGDVGLVDDERDQPARALPGVGAEGGAIGRRVSEPLG